MRVLRKIAPFALLCATCFAQNTPMHTCKPGDSGECATAPKLVHHVEAEYSDHGRRNKINGHVVLTFTVLPDGSTTDIVVTRSLEASLDQQAMRAVRLWRFEPGTYQGSPVAVSLTAEVTFRIY